MSKAPSQGDRHTHHGGKALVGVPKFKPPRDRHVKTRSAPCPSCKAEPKKPCTGPEGNELHWTHKPRRVIALRMEREANEREA